MYCLSISFFNHKYFFNTFQYFSIAKIQFQSQILMGGIQRAGTGKNEKVTEISPLLVFWPEGLGINFL